MKIMVLGRTGQVGTELISSLSHLGQVRGFDRTEADLTDSSALLATVRAFAPDIIANAAAYTAVDRAESEPELAMQINGHAVGVLAEYARTNKALLVHYSTDYVFDGTKASPYNEGDTTNPKGAYARSKRTGEELALESDASVLILRTSWVYAQHGANFVKTMLRLAKERESLSVVADQFGAPTSARLIADVTRRVLEIRRKERIGSGIYHLTAAGETNWNEFARLCVKRARQNGIKLLASEDSITPIPTEAYPAAAPRPKNSRLDTTALSDALQFEFPRWDTDVIATVDALTASERA